MTPGRAVLAAVLAVIVLACASATERPAAAAERAEDAAQGAQDTTQKPGVNPDAQIVAEFQDRVADYIALRGKLVDTLPQLPVQATPEQIQQRQVALERLIRQARSGARQGDMLTQPLRAFIRRQIARVLAGPDGAGVRASLMDENVRGVRLQINGRYPAGVPLTSVPPQILLSLPRLPRELEFRFVGERLALLDGQAQTVLDFMESVLP